ncbi:MAG: hypothetical protein MUF52_15465 [Syntrophobacteraceae bacterium]|jgi:hypothetical protein|nr:hypothetical protein [Syntrophobacteraceae bacterium]
MPVNPKVIAAITAAVGEFLQAEPAMSAPVAVVESRPPTTPPVVFSPWALSGRQSMMDMRRFLQMRLAR